MKHVLPFIWVLLLAVPGRSFAQDFCFFDSLWLQAIENDSMLEWRHKADIVRVNDFRQNTEWNFDFIPDGTVGSGLNPGAGCRNAIFVVPVVVHVVYDPNVPQSNLHDSLIEQQIEILNKAFANEINPSNPFGVNTRIQFCLAQTDPFGTSITGINHIADPNPVSSMFNDAQKNHLASLIYYDKDRYLNIWVVPNIDGAAGYASQVSMGGVDGVVMEYNYFGDYTACTTCGFDSTSRGLTVAHEIGHYLGLFHPFERECTGTDANTCAWKGDFCCDTRPTKRNQNCPVPSVNQCPALPYYGTQPDNYENIMAYASDACKNNFTPDQVSVMHSTLSSGRGKLVSATNVNSLSLSCCLRGTWFNIDNALGMLCDPGPVTFTAIDHGSIDYIWEVYNDTVQVLDTTLSTASFSWPLSRYGKYHVKLTLVTITGRVVLERKNLLELRDCGDVLANSQGNWYFGQYCGLQFRQGGPILDLSAYIATPSPTIHTGEGSISHSDKNGNLLFYAGGDSANQNIFRIYKNDPVLNNHIQVNQSTPMIGHQSSSQAGIVIPFKHDSTRFHLFVASAHDGISGLFRNIIDIDEPDLVLPGSRNLKIPVPIGSDSASGTLGSSEMVTAIPACDSNYWLITSDGASSGSSIPNKRKLLVYLVTDSTVTYVTKSDDIVDQYYGYLKASPDGTKIAGPGIIYNFDRQTGAVSTFKKLPVIDQVYNYYGTSFSPDSRLLYFTTYENGESAIYQYDLESSDSLLNRQKLATHTNYLFFTALQLGPDDKLYVAKTYSDDLAVISNPNEKITYYNLNACGYNEHGPRLKDSDGRGGTSIAGLPNMMDAKEIADIPLDFSMVDSVCGTVTFTPNDACAGTYLWHFGDGDSSTLKTPVHTYTAKDTFQVTLTVNGSTQKSRSIIIGIEKPEIAGDDLVSCNLNDISIYGIMNPSAGIDYQWSVNGGEVVQIEYFNNAYIRWDTSGNVYLRALSTINGCEAKDTFSVVVGELNNNGIYRSHYCATGDSFYLTGNVLTANFIDSNVHYQWQMQTSSTGPWQDISAADTLPDYWGTVPDSIWYRRIAFNDYCESVSNIMRVSARVTILEDLKSQTFCDDIIQRQFPLTLEFDPYEVVTLQLYHFNETFPGNWQWFAYTPTPYPNNFSLLMRPGDSVKIKINLDGCPPVYSKVIPIYQSKLYYNHPSECLNVKPSHNITNVYPGLDTFIYAVLAPENQWLLNIDNFDSSFMWEIDRGDGFVEIPDSYNDTLFFTTGDCAKGVYRVKVKHCDDWGNFAWFTSCSANNASVTVNTGDLWSKDSDLDIGSEPNWESFDKYWASPDLWNNKYPTSYQPTHQNPEYSANTPNMLYTRVRNRSTTEWSQPAKLYLYWTMANSGELWPRLWHYSLTDNYFHNVDPASQFYDRKYPLGYNLSQNPITIGPLAPGTDTIIGASWNVPNPAWYYTVVNGLPVYSDKLHICFLSRIVTCDTDPFGMTFREVHDNTINVRNNNNIVTMNTTILDEFADSVKPKTHVPVYVGGVNESESQIRIQIREHIPTTFFNYAELRIILDDVTYAKWIAGGSVGTGFTATGNTLLVTNINNFEISNLGYDSIGDIFSILFERTITTFPSVPVPYNFLLTQYSGDSDTADGGVHIAGALPVDIPVVGGYSVPDNEDEGSGEQNQSTHKIHKQAQDEESPALEVTPAQAPQEAGITTHSIIAYPNPFSKIVNFAFSLGEESDVDFEIYNSIGIKVGAISNRTYPKGRHTLSFDGSTLAPGAYFCKVNLAGQIQTLRIILNR